MNTLIIVVIALVVFGSIYWLKPSPRDTRLAALRLAAIRSGLHVRQFTFKPNSAKTGVRDDIHATSYTLIDQEQGNKQTSDNNDLQCRIVKQAAWENDGLPEGYSWHDQGSETLAKRFSELLPSFDDELLMLEVYLHQVTIMTAEHKTASADNYQQFMQQLLGKKATPEE